MMKKYYGFFDNGKYKVGCNGGSIHVFDQKDVELTRFKGLSNTYKGAFRPESNVFVAKSISGILVAYDLDKLSLVRKINIHAEAQDEGFAFSTTGSLFYNIEKPVTSTRTQLTVYDGLTFEKKAFYFDNEEKIFTFKDISLLSNRAANYFRSIGIRKGDVVMMILRRRWEYWVCATALHKLGATIIPSTLQLTKKDIIYRGNAAKVKAIVCVNDDFVIEQVEKAMPEIPTLQTRTVVGMPRDGWRFLEEEMSRQSDRFKPERYHACLFHIGY